MLVLKCLYLRIRTRKINNETRMTVQIIAIGEWPHEIRRSEVSFPAISNKVTSTRNKLSETSQCMMVWLIIRGMLYRYGRLR